MKNVPPWAAAVRRALAATACAAALAGCASVASRIEKNPAMFAALAPDVQAAVRDGRLAVGYPRDAAHLVLGRPDRVHSRRSAEGDSEVWIYTAYEYAHDLYWVPISAYYCGARDPHLYGGWGHLGYATEYEAVRVEIRDGKIVALEAVRRR